MVSEMRINVSHDTGLDDDEKANVLIADDHRMVTEAVARLLERSGEFAVRSVGNMNDAVRALSEDGPAFDLLLLDVRMPGVNGLDSIRRAVDRAGDTKIVLFSGEADRRFVAGAVKLGVRGLIPKTMPLKSLVSALNLVLSGEVFLPSDHKMAAPEPMAEPTRPLLTEVETSILRMAADGMINKEIALQIDSSEVSVKMHMRTVCRKLNAKNRTHAAMIARDLSII